MGEMFKGPTANSWVDLRAYTGLAAAERIVGSDRRAAYIVNYNQLDVNYTGTVDFQLRRELVLLCPQTADFLYRTYTPERTAYVAGSRPELEDVVRRATRGAETPADKALALMRFCRDAHLEAGREPSHDDYVYGGTEEELIAKGEWLCEGLSRLYVPLCEVAGIPGRILYHVIGGHVTAEVFVGTWAYVDPRMGVYFRKADGDLASAWDLMNDPSIMANQPDDVKRDVSYQSTWPERVARCRDLFFHPHEVNGFINYRLADAPRYDYAQTTSEQASEAGLWTINREYRALIEAVFEQEVTGFS
ncbi:MAG: hypothetical protein OXG79_09870 [Chloroflexi bacterium]|nr:hypothetical protein [Chloroflexota bacterium]